MSLKTVTKRFKDIYNQWFLKTSHAITTLRRGGLPQNIGLLSPLVLICAFILVILHLGIAAISLITLFCALLTLYFIVTRIFGIDLDWDEVVRV